MFSECQVCKYNPQTISYFEVKIKEMVQDLKKLIEPLELTNRIVDAKFELAKEVYEDSVAAIDESLDDVSFLCGVDSCNENNCDGIRRYNKALHKVIWTLHNVYTVVLYGDKESFYSVTEIFENYGFEIVAGELKTIRYMAEKQRKD